MRRLVVYEHTRIERGGSRRDDRAGDAPVSLEGHLYDRLRSFDRERCGEGDRVFEWSDGYARTTQWVGVVQVPGIQVEILPKIDALGVAVASDEVEASWEARRNLIYMLSVSGDVPVRSRDVARLGSRHASLSETLAALFAARLRRELLRGPERAYLEHADNLRRFKGKLLVSHHVLHNAAHRERFFCGYDELTVDTRMNRIFRASCRLLLELTSRPATQDSLRQCMLLLEGVSDVVLSPELFGGDPRGVSDGHHARHARGWASH